MIHRAYGGRGVGVFSGSGDPTRPGSQGDLYLDVVAKRLWVYDSGSWSLVGSLS